MTQKYYRPCFPDDMTDLEKEFVASFAAIFRGFAKKQKELDDNLTWLQSYYEGREAGMRDAHRKTVIALLKRLPDEPNNNL